jgi:hypothetical protein
MTEEEEWLASHTFLCDRFHAQIQPKQCKINQRAEHQLCINCPQKANVEAGILPPVSAGRLSGWQSIELKKRGNAKAMDTGIGVEPRVAHIVAGDIEMGEKTGKPERRTVIGTCGVCLHPDKTLVSKYGPCWKCYDTKRKALNPSGHRTCSAEGCTKYPVKEGMCMAHHKAMQSVPDPVTATTPPAPPDRRLVKRKGLYPGEVACSA